MFGATGMAFRMNIERSLCPSGPYCWNMDEFLVLLENLGIRMQVVASPGSLAAQTNPKSRPSFLSRKMPPGIVSKSFSIAATSSAVFGVWDPFRLAKAAFLMTAY